MNDTKGATELKGMHSYVTMLTFIGSRDTSAAVEWVVNEFELETHELSDFITWAKHRGFVTEISDTQEPRLSITHDGSKWVMQEIWSFFTGESTGEI